MNSCISNLTMFEIDIANWDLIFILLCSDCQTLSDKTSIPKWSHLNEFLYERFRTLEWVSENRFQDPHNSQVSETNCRSSPKINTVKTFQTKFKAASCPLCPADKHIIRKCPKLLALSPQDRSNEIRKQRLCIHYSSNVLQHKFSRKFSISSREELHFKSW